MKQHLALVSILVHDYDAAIVWYRDVLGFDLVEDTPLEPGKRWVVLAPPGATECRLLLAQARGDEQIRAVGNQSGGRVFLFLHTDDFHRDHAAMLARGVRFLEEPRHESYGTVAIFEDLCGNRWDLLNLHR